MEGPRSRERQLGEDAVTFRVDLAARRRAHVDRREMGAEGFDSALVPAGMPRTGSAPVCFH